MLAGVSRLVGMVLALLVALAAGGNLAPASRALPLDAARRDGLVRLAEPIEQCIRKLDTGSEGAFRGCYDWHSAVHANLALRIVSRLTGESRYRGVADEVATPAAIDAERSALASGDLAVELPYGYAWLLLLDHEANRDHIHTAALDVLGPLRAWLRDALDAPAHVRATRYTSSTFPAYALHRWYSRFDPERAKSFAAGAAPRLLAQRDVACAAQARRSGFLDPCASLLLALSQMARDTAVDRDALEEMARTVASRRPLRAADLTTIFEAGLNFSRAWALYAAADVLGDRTLLERGDLLFDVHLAQPGLWRQRYADYSHWVAQFGVYALALRSEIGRVAYPTPSPTAVPLPRPEPGDPAWLGPWPVGPSVWAY